MQVFFKSIQGVESRYGLLNDIIMCEALGDDRTRRELLRTYEEKSLLSEALFGEK